jgi:hypothetical protein
MPGFQAATWAKAGVVRRASVAAFERREESILVGFVCFGGLGRGDGVVMGKRVQLTLEGTTNECSPFGRKTKEVNTMNEWKCPVRRE